MKTNIILIALFVAAFMFPSIGSVDTADAETDISHCANLEATAARPACEAAAHVKPAPGNFDDTLMGAQGAESSPHATPIDPATSGYSSDASAMRMGTESSAKGRYGTSYRHELRENNRLRNGIPGSGRKMGTESNANGRYGTSYRHELRENNRLRNGIPGSGRKMK